MGQVKVEENVCGKAIDEVNRSTGKNNLIKINSCCCLYACIVYYTAKYGNNTKKEYVHKLDKSLNTVYSSLLNSLN